MHLREHWQSVYERHPADAFSWFQREPAQSLALIRRANPAREGVIVDIGGGDSTLIDGLLADGYSAVTVLDLAPAALARAQARLGAAAERVRWLEADVRQAAFAPASIDVWHDRAVFHFLTEADDRARYVALVRQAVRPGGHVLVATFAEDGPLRCSGLPVMRYAPAELHGAFGPGFRLLQSIREDHRTPTGAHQAFTYCLCQREAESNGREAA